MDDFLSGLMMVGAIVLGALHPLRLSGYVQGNIAQTNTSAPLANAYSDKFRPSFERSVKAGWI
jgi:hypothetical protein